MEKTTQHYESPEIEVLKIQVATPLAASNLENPEDGGEWVWD